MQNEELFTSSIKKFEVELSRDVDVLGSSESKKMLSIGQRSYFIFMFDVRLGRDIKLLTKMGLKAVTLLSRFSVFYRENGSNDFLLISYLYFS